MGKSGLAQETKNKWYDIKNLESKMCHYNFIIGQRSNGKSYQVKSRLVKLAYETKSCYFGLVWRYEKDIKQDLITSYFADLPISRMTDGVYDTIVAWHGSIYLAKQDDESDKIEKGLMIGKYFALNVSTRYKSKAYPTIQEIEMEELFATKSYPYLSDEVELFMQLCSTIFRKRPNCRVWFIGNTISRVCPYFTDFKISSALHMQQGTINIYEMEHEDGTKTRIAVERCEKSSEGTKSNLFFGKFEKNIEEGEWECDEYPKLTTPYKECEVVYQLTLKHSDFAFNIDLLFQSDDNPYVYVYPNTSGKYRERLITNEFYNSHLVDNRLNWNRGNSNRAEKLIHDLFLLGKVVYSDNLTAEDFNSTLKLFEVYPL